MARPLREDHPLVDRSGQPAGTYTERAHPLTASLRVGQSGTVDHQPAPGLCRATYVASHAIRTVTLIEPRPAPSIGPGGTQHRPDADALSLFNDGIGGHGEPVPRQLEPPAQVDVLLR